MKSYAAWRALLEGAALPAAVIDLDAVDHNLGVLRAAMRDGPGLRVASKSIRVPAVVRYVLDALGERASGVMTFSAHETLRYAEEGFDDLLLAYPIGRPDEAVALTKASSMATVRVVVDDLAQARILSEAARGAGVTVRVCLELDASWRPLHLAAVHLGVRRSPLRTPADVVRVARGIRGLTGLTVDSLMAYEAQVAGLPDHSTGPRVMDAVKRLIKTRSMPEVVRRRGRVVEALRTQGCELSVVNGGGTGSVHATSRDPSVTEVTAGSGFLCSHLFDGYDGLDLRPAAFFALGIVRRPGPGFVTCAGGGYIASGPAGPDRLPVVHLPRGLEPLGVEGFGEVQTPLTVGPEAPPLGIGDPVICRHAKAGELFERFDRVHLVRGDEVAEVVPTLRGMGTCFF